MRRIIAGGKSRGALLLRSRSVAVGTRAGCRGYADENIHRAGLARRGNVIEAVALALKCRELAWRSSWIPAIFHNRLSPPPCNDSLRKIRSLSPPLGTGGEHAFRR